MTNSRMTRLRVTNVKPYIQLMRPANLVTAGADVLAGAAIAGFSTGTTPALSPALGLLLVSTVGLYGGGVVFNDVFDAELDAVERPERPLPSGRVSLGGAAALGGLLLLVGIAAAWFHDPFSGILALAIAAAALVYDRFGKHHAVLGPLNMGLCRGLNLLLGVSLVPAAVGEWAVLGLVPVAYIAAVTMVSRGEVHGGSRGVLNFAAVLYAGVSLSQLFLAWRMGTLPVTLPFVALHLVLIFRPLLVAMANPVGPNIGRAVKAGVLALVAMDAAWVAASGNWPLALLVLALLPLSLGLARWFAVT